MKKKVEGSLFVRKICSRPVTEKEDNRRGRGREGEGEGKGAGKNSRAVYSTINLTFFQPLPGYNPSIDSPGFLTRTSKAFKTGFDFIAEIFIGIISIWPLGLLAFVAWIFWKRHSLRVVASKQKL